MNITRIECPHCQNPIQIETPEKKLPLGALSVAFIACAGIAFGLGAISQKANPPSPIAAIKPAPLPDPLPIPTPEPAAAAPVVAQAEPTTPPGPDAIGAYGWYLGAKLPSLYAFDPVYKPSHIYTDKAAGKMAPFDEAEISCLQDRRICAIKLRCVNSDQMQVVEAALKAKYGDPGMNFGESSMEYIWEHADTKIILTEFHNSGGFYVDYESVSLGVRSTQEYESSNNAAASKIISHL